MVKRTGLPKLLNSGTILVADDEEGVRAVTQAALELAGYKVLMAEDGRQALEIFKSRKQEISAVLLDLGMPEMTGDQVFREIHRLSKKTRVILSSGYGEDDTSDYFGEEGVSGFIRKPYRAQELIKKVREVVDS